MYRLILTSVFAVFFATVVYAQPANDSCQNAVPITLDEEVDFATIGATTDGPRHLDCLGANDSIPADIWFTFTATAGGPLRWSNCGTANYDSRMAVYATGAPCLASDANLVNCNDDGADPSCNEFFTSELIFLAVAGQSYTLRLGGFANADVPTTTGIGTVVLSAVTGGPANDFCAAALPVELGLGHAFSTVHAITDGPNHEGSPCFGFGSITATNDIWYTYTPDFNGFVEWATCNTASFDTRLAVYVPGSACPPANEDLYSCNDDGAGCADFSSRLTFQVIAGQTYLLRIGGWNGENGDGTFDLSMVMPAPSPANDNCANAETVSLLTQEVADELDVFTQGTTISASFVSENYQFPNCLGNQGGGEFGDVWYRFETLGNEEIGVRLFPTSSDAGAADNFFLDFFSSCSTRLDSNQYSGTCFSVSENLVIAEGVLSGLPADSNLTLFVRVTSRLTTEVPGTFGFQLIGAIVSSTRDQGVFATDIQLFPNPVSDLATVRFSLAEATVLHALVYDQLGRRVQRFPLGRFEAGQQSFALPTAQFKSGLYLLELNNGPHRQQLKFVVR